MKWGSKNISKLQYGSKNIIAAYWGGKKVFAKKAEVIASIANVGDIAYWDGSAVKAVPLSGWKDSLGTPVGVVMIPENFIPDGKARIISLTSMNDGDYLRWDTANGIGVDSTAPNFEGVVGTDNTGSTTHDPYGHGQAFLPSDRNDWSGIQSYVDPLTKYSRTSEELNMVGGMGISPSPYLRDSGFNPIYSVYNIEGGNALSDFNGLSNTQSLVNEGEQYEAARTCWNYKDTANSNLQWYLPAMGELGFLMPRFELINQSIQAVGGTPVEEGCFLSSSERSSAFWGLIEAFTWSLDTADGKVCVCGKAYDCLVRPVAIFNWNEHV